MDKTVDKHSINLTHLFQHSVISIYSILIKEISHFFFEIEGPVNILTNNQQLCFIL